MGPVKLNISEQLPLFSSYVPGSRHVDSRSRSYATLPRMSTQAIGQQDILKSQDPSRYGVKVTVYI